MTHRCKHRVRTYELDGYGHVNNATYLNYLEYARVTFLHDIGFDYDLLIKQGFALYLTRVCIDYRKPATLGDELTITTSPLKKKLTHGIFRQVIECDGDKIIEADVHWVCVDAKGKPSRLPKEFDVPALEPSITNT